MVLLACSLPCRIRPISSRVLSTATATARSVSHVRSCSSVRASLTPRVAMASKMASKSSPPYLSNLPSLRIPASTRLLTTQREKVKVLLVLYDGGKHAEEVSSQKLFPQTPLPNSENDVLLLSLFYSTVKLAQSEASLCRLPAVPSLGICESIVQ
ncbi:hypothetical protein F4820DRAFT_184561 [Hypoxylon rubiginosum]|uniref:Uncharacterized protein n=1 Tax=Hypoxylon rubiginosum TaxID=110542 RepID=A0ACB9Z7G7_9PEZI|nr:hypothetical protein F4820DRAFT_184561 [Hypoxylon rubiginosum]